MRERPHPLRLLTIAGSDSGGGAGIQADLKTFAAHGAYGMSAVTAVTAQNTRAVTAVYELPPELVTAQIDAVFDDLGVDGVKIGMLANAAIVRAVARCLRRRLRDAAPPVVLDPVMVAKSGDPLLAADAVEALIEDLLPLATLVTPNLPEAARLTGLPTAGEGEREVAARSLAASGPAVLLKGGHGEGPEVVDLLVDLSAEDPVRRFRRP
ncbi:MAG TPA: bifunctional hydroxymethylpyrimidine kinase/phosphomethylpyrimidine kinase, partial [Thermoanaerobaculia bacterium]|nr:bifunctional hydroxymethylpyrimidine kinase/phosphomethylpyrimidine kinase [Thermoanaerobaculia bacterium]